MREIQFEITFAQFVTLWGKPCAYCGAGINTIGLDRIDNTLGYIFSNVAPCCSVCNYMKRMWGCEFFIAHCWKVVMHSGL